MKTNLHYVFFISFFLLTFSISGQQNYWNEATFKEGTQGVSLKNLDDSNYKVYQLDNVIFKQQLVESPIRGQFSGKSNTIVSFPNENGKLENFRVIEVPVLSEELSLRYPNIKTYLGFSIDNPGIRIRFSVTPLGVNAMISYTDRNASFLSPATKISNGQYLVYNRAANLNATKSFECLTEDTFVPKRENILSNTNRAANDQILRTLRIAISTTGEYTNFWDDGNAGNGNAQEDALAQVVSTLNRSNEVFEVDMAVTFTLVTGIEIIFPDPATDPYTGSLSSQLQSTLTSIVTEANYNIGHLFDFGSNTGSAGCIGCVCVDGQKGRGFSSHSFLDNDGGLYMTDFFDIDYVPHEIGHQMGANHTFSHSNEGTGVQAEPGSGTTIMGYAGITGSNDVQDHSDPYFHYNSIDQILDNLDIRICWTNTAISNNPPVANAGNDYTIPQGTAFILKGASTDADGGDTHTYTWEQIDNGITISANFGPTKTSGAIWRSRPPNISPNRYMPILSRVIAGLLTETNPLESVDNSTWETVSTVARDLNFALTVRDRSETNGIGQMPQSSFDAMIVTVNGTAGPFLVTSQSSTGISWTPSATETITWDVAGTTANGVNTANVNILLSTDGGLTFPTVLASNTPNDGSHDIMVPVTSSLNCRIMIEAIDNIFYAVNSNKFTIGNFITSCTQYASAANLNLAIPDNTGSPVSHIINIPDSKTIDFIKVNVDVSHTWINDLTIQIQHPDGTTFTNVWNRDCAGENDLDVIFEDGAPAIVCSEPTIGTYNPNSALNVFSGLDSAGDWTIAISDNAGANTGILNNWYIDICETILRTQKVYQLTNLSIFPNPNNGEFTVKLNSNSGNDLQLIVYDIRGRRVFNNTYNNASNFNEVISLGNVQSGIYLLNISDGVSSTTKKIIVN